MSPDFVSPRLAAVVLQSDTQDESDSNTPGSDDVPHNPAALARNVLKKPAAVGADKPVAMKYTMMFYRKQNMFAIRRAFGDAKQIFQFGGKDKPEKKLRAIGERALDLLNVQKHNEHKVKELSRAEAKQLFKSRCERDQM